MKAGDVALNRGECFRQKPDEVYPYRADVNTALSPTPSRMDGKEGQ
jgi:hypothetical protein